MGSISGTIISSFIITGGLEILRFFDEPLSLFDIQFGLFRPGFRMVIFSIILVTIVLFWRTGIMSKIELTWDKILQSPSYLINKIKKGVKP